MVLRGYAHAGCMPGKDLISIQAAGRLTLQLRNDNVPIITRSRTSGLYLLQTLVFQSKRPSEWTIHSERFGQACKARILHDWDAFIGLPPAARSIGFPPATPPQALGNACGDVSHTSSETC
jgi:hypothetical protein